VVGIPVVGVPVVGVPPFEKHNNKIGKAFFITKNREKTVKIHSDFPSILLDLTSYW
jgi:hypothetical protein